MLALLPVMWSRSRFHGAASETGERNSATAIRLYRTNSRSLSLIQVAFQSSQPLECTWAMALAVAFLFQAIRPANKCLKDMYKYSCGHDIATTAPLSTSGHVYKAKAVKRDEVCESTCQKFTRNACDVHVLIHSYNRDKEGVIVQYRWQAWRTMGTLRRSNDCLEW